MRSGFVASGVWDGLRRNASMTIALILSTAIALAFVGAAVLANIEISRFQKDYESRLNVSVYLCAQQSPRPCQHPATGSEISALQQQLRAYPAVTAVTFITQKEQYRRALQIEPRNVAKLLKRDELPASFTVKLADIAHDYPAFSTRFDAASGVLGVSNQIGVIRKLLNLIDGVRLLAIAIAAVVLIASVLLIANTIQVAANQRRNETSIMRLVGASRLMTELPFLLETVIAALIGGLIAFGLLALAKFYLLGGLFQVQVSRHLIPNLDVNDVLIASGIGLAGGVVLAAVTAVITLRTYVRL
jgi:cell division transport system permease protein